MVETYGVNIAHGVVGPNINFFSEVTEVVTQSSTFGNIIPVLQSGIYRIHDKGATDMGLIISCLCPLLMVGCIMGDIGLSLLG